MLRSGVELEHVNISIQRGQVEAEHLGTFRDQLRTSRCLLGVPNLAPWVND